MTTAHGQAVDELRTLPPIKVVGRAGPAPEHKREARIGDFAELLGYDMKPPGEPLQPGDQLTVTLHYRVTAAPPGNYTRFLHLRGPEGAMITQHDSLPEEGRNPTWAWALGEIVTDQITLSLPPELPAGEYSLITGFYNPQAGGARVPLRDADGRTLVDGQIEIAGWAVPRSKDGR